jgi:hypothetical protein
MAVDQRGDDDVALDRKT